MKRFLIGLGVAALSAWTLAPTVAAAEPQSGPRLEARTVQIVGSEEFSPDEFFSITYRFATRHLTVQQGATVTWDNKTNDVHTVSVVAPADLPRTTAQIDNCSVCNQLMGVHFPNGFPPQGAPVLFVDDFKAGQPPARLDSVGDSILVAPPGQGFPTTSSAQITAPVGSTLNYMCMFHPWMQATLHVVAADEDPR